MGKKGMACEYRAAHEFGADGFCNLCFKAKLVAEKEEAALAPAPPVKLDEATTVELPTGWTINGIQFITAPVHDGDSFCLPVKLMPMQELSWLEAAGANATPAQLARAAELRAQYHPYTEKGLEEQAKRDAEAQARIAKQESCEHRALVLSECGYEAECAACGSYFDEVDLDELMAQRRHLEQVKLTASRTLAMALAPKLTAALQEMAAAAECAHAVGPRSINSDSLSCCHCGKTWGFEAVMAAATQGDGETVACECGWKGTLGKFVEHRQQEQRCG